MDRKSDEPAYKPIYEAPHPVQYPSTKGDGMAFDNQFLELDKIKANEAKRKHGVDVHVTPSTYANAHLRHPPKDGEVRDEEGNILVPAMPQWPGVAHHSRNSRGGSNGTMGQNAHSSPPVYVQNYGGNGGVAGGMRADDPRGHHPVPGIGGRGQPVNPYNPQARPFVSGAYQGAGQSGAPYNPQARPFVSGAYQGAGQSAAHYNPQARPFVSGAYQGEGLQWQPGPVYNPGSAYAQVPMYYQAPVYGPNAPPQPAQYVPVPVYPSAALSPGRPDPYSHMMGGPNLVPPPKDARTSPDPYQHMMAGGLRGRGQPVQAHAAGATGVGNNHGQQSQAYGGGVYGGGAHAGGAYGGGAYGGGAYGGGAYAGGANAGGANGGAANGATGAANAGPPKFNFGRDDGNVYLAPPSNYSLPGGGSSNGNFQSQIAPSDSISRR